MYKDGLLTTSTQVKSKLQINRYLSCTFHPPLASLTDIFISIFPVFPFSAIHVKSNFINVLSRLTTSHTLPPPLHPTVSPWLANFYLTFAKEGMYPGTSCIAVSKISFAIPFTRYILYTHTNFCYSFSNTRFFTFLYYRYFRCNEKILP